MLIKTERAVLRNRDRLGYLHFYQINQNVYIKYRKLVFKMKMYDEIDISSNLRKTIGQI